jgi:transcriptional regulator with XRE-family HTH domain
MTHTQLRLAVQAGLKDRRVTAVAAATGLNINTIYSLIRGKRRSSIGTVMLLANYLGIDAKGDTNVVSE